MHNGFISKDHLKQVLSDIQHFLIQLDPAMGAHVLVGFFWVWRLLCCKTASHS